MVGTSFSMTCNTVDWPDICTACLRFSAQLLQGMGEWIKGQTDMLKVTSMDYGGNGVRPFLLLPNLSLKDKMTL